MASLGGTQARTTSAKSEVVFRGEFGVSAEVEIRVFDISSKLVLTQRSQADTPEIRVDFAGHPKGVYAYGLWSSAGRISGKFVN